MFPSTDQEGEPEVALVKVDLKMQDASTLTKRDLAKFTNLWQVG